VFDGDLSSLSEQFTTQRTITARLADGEEITILSTRAETAAATSRLLAEHDVVDLTIEDPPIDDVIEQVFADARDAS
jgi:ABC-2 type transport system ATP-binding protein